jgi:hypothetical protein
VRWCDHAVDHRQGVSRRNAAPYLAAITRVGGRGDGQAVRGGLIGAVELPIVDLRKRIPDVC